MTAQKLNNLYTNYFLGGYISNLIDNPDKPYISIAMKSYDDKASDTVFIMIFKQAGYGKNKYPNPTATIVKDAFEKQCPIACVYYNDGNGGNKMSCCYTNFTATGNTGQAQKHEPADNTAFRPVAVSVATDDDEFPF